MTSRILYLTIILFVVSFIGCTKKQSGESTQQTVSKGPVLVYQATDVTPRTDRVSNFSWKDDDGKTIDLDSYMGRVTVINFWATWCPPCKAELPDLIALSKDLAGKNVKFIGISVDRGANVLEDLRTFTREKGIPYPVIISNPGLEEAFGSPRAIPTTYIVNAKGAITRTLVGLQSKDVFASAITAAMD